MANKRYISTKSDYTFKKRHKSLSDGAIYESDHMTISPIESLFNNNEYVLADSNFRFGTRVGINLQKKHKRGNWVPNNACSATPYVWTTECFDNYELIADEKIRLKPDYTSLKQFAYYGSAVNLIKGSINDIILNFPAELYFTDEPLMVSYRDSEGFIEYRQFEDYKLISNDFSIDVDTIRVDETEIFNSLRYFCLSYSDYEIIKEDGSVEPVTLWISSGHSLNVCEGEKRNDGGLLAEVTINNAKIIVYRDFNSNKKILGYKTKGKKHNYKRIRPKEVIIDNYFDKIDDFERVLLNRETNPIYKANFKTPKETLTGNKYTLKSYIWPSKYGFNPDIETSSFDIYYEALYSLAQFHDEIDSDNLWRNLTHEAIKNLDWTYLNHDDDQPETITKIDTTRVEPIIKIWGRQFDDLKRHLDNIKFCNSISYDEKNNIPDYFLPDILQLDGWETKNIFEGDKDSVSDVLYPSQSKGYTYGKANSEFYRRLKLNSKYILRSKGTRRSIESLMALLGFSANEYKIHENIAIAKSKAPYKTGFTFNATNDITIQYPLTNEVIGINKSRNDFYIKHGYNGLGGIPVKSVSLITSGGSEISYVVPWFDNTTKYDGGLYYQMNGGWCKRKSKKINLEIAPNIKKIESENSGLQIYDETESYLHFVNNLVGLTEISTKEAKQGTIAYVTDLSDITTVYNFKDNEEKNEMLSNLSGHGFSHYFVLENSKMNFYVGYSKNSSIYGWRNLLTKEITGATSYYAKRLLYLESLENKTEGNNPHIGKGTYDDGQEYLNRMGQIFHYGLNNGKFTSFDEEICEDIKNYGYLFSGLTEDNKKCWYFSDTQFNTHDTAYKGMSIEDYKKLPAEQKLGDLVRTNSEKGDGKFSLLGFNEKINANFKKAYNPERQNGETEDTNDIAAANSIVNVKNMKLDFYYPKSSSTEYIEEFTDFIDNNVMFYLKQILPASSIFSYGILEADSTWDDGGKDPVRPDDPPVPPTPPEEKETAEALMETYTDISMVDIIGLADSSLIMVGVIDDERKRIVD